MQARKINLVDGFAGKLAVVTGGGSGMGRELVRQLAAQGCSIVTCDWNADAVADTAAAAATVIRNGVRSGAWRILVGEDAKTLDAAVRAKPEAAYDYPELAKMAAEAQASNHNPKKT